MRIGPLQLDRRTFRSRVARRVFGGFLVGALLPVTAFAVFSFVQVSDQLETQARRQLRSESKALGMALLDRLVALDTGLAALARDEVLPREAPGLLRLRRLPRSRAEALGLGPRDERQRRILAEGRSILRVAPATGDGPPPLVLVRAAGPDPGDPLLVAELDPARVWRPDALRADVEVAVIGADGEILFATTGRAGAVAREAEGGSAEVAGEPHLRESWTLFLRSTFAAPSWDVVLLQPTGVVLAPARRFRTAFALVALLAVWTALLLGIGLIRRSLVPIETLRAATRRLGEGDFEVRVRIESEDEFRDLGETFNAMAGRLGQLTRNLEHEVALRTRDLEHALAELREAQAQLVHQEKMASVGQFVAGIAHEMNNPMSFVEGNLHFLRQHAEALASALSIYEREAAKADPELRERLAEARRALDVDFVIEDLEPVFEGCADGIQRTTALIRDLRTFSRLDDADCLPVDLNEALESTLNVMRARLDGVAIERDYAPLPPVECQAGQVNQVFMNLLANAADAVEGEGRVVLRTLDLGDGRVAVEVEDDGCGIPPEIQSRIFEPFFTTKEVGRGTGLGLSVSYGIVERHAGRIEVDSRPGAGTRFRVELPVVFRAGRASKDAGGDVPGEEQ